MSTVSVKTLRGRVAFWSLALSLLAGLLIVASTCQLNVDVPEVEPVPVAKPASSLRVVSLNALRWCLAESDRRDRMISWLQTQRPDVVALQELNGCSAKTLATDAETWGHSNTVFLFNQGDPLGLTSTAPITEVVITRDGFYYGLLEGTTHGIRFFVVHLHPWSYKTRQDEIALLMERATAYIDKGVEVVLLGDFNALSSKDKPLHEDGQLRSYTSRSDLWVGVNNLNNGELDFEAMRQVEESSLIDLMAIFQQLPEQRITFPTPLLGNTPGRSLNIQRRLDYIFATPPLAQRTIWAGVVIDESTHWLSDHYPLLVDFRRTVPAKGSP